MTRATVPDPRLVSRVLELAERGRYSVSPNPMVGALVARGSTVLAEAFHERAGGPHAEAQALAKAGGAARGADLYVSLEPCVHFGRTPPCAPIVAASGVRRVFVVALDPNPRVHGRGVAALRGQEIGVTLAGRSDRLRAERQNEKFAVWIRERRPFVLAKWAATLDGKIASSSGESRWITGEVSRRRALMLREEYDAVLVGAGTVDSDDPRLSRRLGLNRVTPHRRIVLDGRLRTAPTARAFRNPEGALLVTALPLGHPRARAIARRGVDVWSVPGSSPGKVALGALLRRLGREGISSLMVEGGSQTLGSFFVAGLVDRVAVFTAPKILGGSAAPGPIGGSGFPLRRAPRIVSVVREQFGEDWLVTARVARGRR